MSPHIFYIYKVLIALKNIKCKINKKENPFDLKKSVATGIIT